MDFNIIKIAAFIALILVYLVVRNFFKRLADFTEKLGNTVDSSEEIESLNAKIISLEEKINNKS